MPGEYASKTEVPVSRSRDEVERTLTRFGADSFAYSTSKDGQVMVAFELRGYRIVMRMQLPSVASVRDEYGRTLNGRPRSESVIEKEWEQRCRQRWRTLAAAMKAKLSMIDDGISSFEREFLADIVVGDQTVGEQLIPQLKAGTLAIDGPAKVVQLSSRATGTDR